MSLSGKERRFIAAFARTGDPAEAAREAGYKDKGGARTVKRVLAKSEAQDFLKVCQDAGESGPEVEAAAAVGPNSGRVSLDSLTEELEEARCRAVDAGQSSAAIAATMGKAKLHGLDHPNTQRKGRKAPEKIERVIVNPKNSDS